jgi:multiple sugar transport system permease protein
MKSPGPLIRAGTPHPARWLRDLAVAVPFVVPYLVLFVFFKLGPLAVNILASLTQLDITGIGNFIGLGNFVKLASDTLFWKALGNTFYYLALVGPINIVGGFLLALLLNQPLRGRIATRTVVFMPYIIMVTVVGMIWRWILDTRFGILNYYLSMLGIPAIPWLTSSAISMIAIVIASVWWTIGYNTVIFLAALQDIPKELLDAAAIDGAGPLRKVINVVIPGVKSAVYFVVLTTVIYSMQVFGQVYTMTGGGPNYSTVTVVHYLYIQGFRTFHLGYAASIGFVLFVTVIILSVLINAAFSERRQKIGVTK